MRKAVQRCAASLPRSLSSAPSVQPFAVYRLGSQRIALQWTTIRQTHSSPLRQQQAAAVETSSHIDVPSPGGVTTFDQLETNNLVHPALVRALTKDMGLETMTEVQQKTINEALRGDDIVAQAKTGTGKTLAFLIPIIQRILSVDPSLAQRVYGRRGQRTTADDIRALIISPTRELAEQIAVEAKRLVRHTGLIVQTAVGGSHKRAGLQAIQQQGCHILVGTPGRLKDILSDPYTRVEAPDLDAFVLDEADRLMDQGFWPEIQQISEMLPNPQEKDRQTLMFSATIPKEVVTLVRSTLKPGFNYVQCVQEDEDPTHPNVTQRVVTVLGFENALPALVELCQRSIDASKEPGGKPFKALVYFNSTAEVALALSALQGLAPPGSSPEAGVFGGSRTSHPWPGTRILEIHAKLAQQARTHAAESFRRTESAILLSSDVTARGMDFPNVTHVIQVGLPPSREQYIHRVGRTARAGREGAAWLLLNQLEAEEARSRLRRLPLVKDSSLETAKIDLTKEAQVPVAAGKVLGMFQTAMRRVPAMDKAAVYRAQIGVYGWHSDKQALVDHMNNLARYGWGMPEPPFISPTVVDRLGMRRVQGLNIGNDPARRDESRGGGFGGRGGGFGGRENSFGIQEGGPGRRDDNGFGQRGGVFGGNRSGGSFGRPFDRGGRGGDRGGREFSRPPPSSFGRGGRGSFDRRQPKDDPFGL